MKRSRTEVGRWRMLRQVSRRKARWLEGQSRRNMRILPSERSWLNGNVTLCCSPSLNVESRNKRHRSRCLCFISVSFLAYILILSSLFLLPAKPGFSRAPALLFASAAAGRKSHRAIPHKTGPTRINAKRKCHASAHATYNVRKASIIERYL